MIDPGRTNILCVVGTRPEAIKMAPVIRALRSARWARIRVVLSGQHRDLVEPMLDFFGVSADIRLNAMRPGQPVSELVRRMTDSLRGVMAVERPDFVLAQGDTSTVLAAALASFQHGTPFGHVEAGLRTGDLHSPFPEEANRVIVTHLSAVHFAPTHSARANLLREGVAPGDIHVTGNTVIDALRHAASVDRPIGVPLDASKRLILVTAHRRETLGEPLEKICEAVRTLHDGRPDIEFLWPVHPNPAVGSVVRSRHGDLARVHLCEPLGYGEFVAAMTRCTLILSDSGGIQEEAPALGKPVLVLRSGSERPEAVASGWATIVGHEPSVIVAETLRRLEGAPDALAAVGLRPSPFGDGHAARRIVQVLASRLGVSTRRRAAG